MKFNFVCFRCNILEEDSSTYMQDIDGHFYCQDCMMGPIEYTDKELVESLKYLLTWSDTDFGPGRYVNFPEIEYDGHGGIRGYTMYAKTKKIHRNDEGKYWRVFYKTGEECIVAMAKILPTVNTDSDYIP